MVYRAHVRNGMVVLDEPVALPEGAEVRVDLLEMSSSAGSDDQSLTLFERLKPVIGAAHGLPSDAATNVDHYLYGHPKK